MSVVKHDFNHSAFRPSQNIHADNCSRVNHFCKHWKSFPPANPTTVFYDDLWWKNLSALDPGIWSMCFTLLHHTVLRAAGRGLDFCLRVTETTFAVETSLICLRNRTPTSWSNTRTLDQSKTYTSYDERHRTHVDFLKLTSPVYVQSWL